MPFAARNDAHLVRVRGCDKDLSGKRPVWTLILAPEGNGFGGTGWESNITEGERSYSSDAIAQLRAGRLLANDPPPPASADQIHRARFSLLEGAITGSGRYQARECVVTSIYRRYGKQSFWRELARLQAIFLLKATGTVDHVLDLTFGPVRGGTVAVTFRGRRPHYAGREPRLVEVTSTCSLQ